MADRSAALKTEQKAETMRVRVLLLGERIETRSYERQESLATLPLTLRLPEGGTAVVFRWGVIVLFNAPEAAERALLEKLVPLVIEPLGAKEVEETRIQVRPDADEPVEASGTIFLRDSNLPRLQLVADILAKSQVLAHYEVRVSGIFDSIQPLANTLREKGRPAAYSRDLMRQIGNVLEMQHRMVGRVEPGEKPELLWDHPELERLYLRLADEYELRERDRALNSKLAVIARTVETVLSLLQSRSSLRVEWYILALIVAELLLSLYPPTLWR